MTVEKVIEARKSGKTVPARGQAEPRLAGPLVKIYEGKASWGAHYRHVIKAASKLSHVPRQVFPNLTRVPSVSRIREYFRKRGKTFVLSVSHPVGYGQVSALASAVRRLTEGLPSGSVEKVVVSYNEKMGRGIPEKRALTLPNLIKRGERFDAEAPLYLHSVFDAAREFEGAVSRQGYDEVVESEHGHSFLVTVIKKHNLLHAVISPQGADDAEAARITDARLADLQVSNEGAVRIRALGNLVTKGKVPQNSGQSSRNPDYYHLRLLSEVPPELTRPVFRAIEKAVRKAYGTNRPYTVRVYGGGLPRPMTLAELAGRPARRSLRTRPGADEPPEAGG